MPRANYSYGDNDGQRPFGIAEPVNEWGSDRAGIQAKEPDRQSATRQGTQSSRSRGAMAEEENEGSSSSSRAKSGPRGSSRKGTQARRASDRGQTARRSTTTESRTSRQKKSRRGFAAMSPEQQRDIARKGGLTVSRNRRHMADIGRIGGEHSHGGRRSRR